MLAKRKIRALIAYLLIVTGLLVALYDISRKQTLAEQFSTAEMPAAH
jgi:hypothetical protein